MSDIRLLLLGAGYTASFAASSLAPLCQSLRGTSRTQDRFDRLRAAGIQPVLFNADKPTTELKEAVQQATHIIVSISPTASASQPDPAVALLSDLLSPQQNGFTQPWVAYLSTIGVYGDSGGEWVDEASVCTPISARSEQRLRAEQAWQALSDTKACRLAIFRLPGIYGPGRNALLNLHQGKARRLVKQGQVFNRVHVVDIATALRQSILADVSGIFNICDGAPSPPQDVISYAAELMGVDAPAEVDFETADLSPMARSFYAENKRVSHSKSLGIAGMQYRYQNYQSGLSALWQSGQWRLQ